MDSAKIYQNLSKEQTVSALNRVTDTNVSGFFTHYTSNMERLWALSNAPKGHFEHYYKPVIQACFQLAYHLAPHPTQHPWLSTQLTRAEHALHYRRGRFLPPHAEPEDLANESDLWTYAVFSGAVIFINSAWASSGLYETVASVLIPGAGLDWLATNHRVVNAWSSFLHGNTQSLLWDIVMGSRG